MSARRGGGDDGDEVVTSFQDSSPRASQPVARARWQGGDDGDEYYPKEREREEENPRKARIVLNSLVTITTRHHFARKSAICAGGGVVATVTASSPSSPSVNDVHAANVSQLTQGAVMLRVCEECAWSQCLPDSWTDALMCRRTCEVVAWDYSCDDHKPAGSEVDHDTEDA